MLINNKMFYGNPHDNEVVALYNNATYLYVVSVKKIIADKIQIKKLIDNLNNPTSAVHLR